MREPWPVFVSAAFVAGCSGAWEWGVAAMVIATTTALVIRHRRKQARTKLAADVVRHAFDRFAELVPGLHIDPHESGFVARRGSARASLDMESLRRLFVHRASHFDGAADEWLCDQLSKHTDPAAHERTEREMRAALETRGNVLEASSDQDFFIVLGGERRTISRAALAAALFGLEVEEDRQAVIEAAIGGRA
jgi:hypothetical protein